MDIILIENLKVLQSFYTFTIEGSHFIKGRSRNLHLVRLGPYSMAVFRASPSDACYSNRAFAGKPLKCPGGQLLLLTYLHCRRLFYDRLPLNRTVVKRLDRCMIPFNIAMG